MTIYVIAGLGLFFLCPAISILTVWVYERGIRAQIRREKGIEPEPIKTPLQIIDTRREAKQSKAQQDLITQGMANIFAYDGTPQRGGEDA
jgi:hypothetical protein